jgi:ComEC/Rec2-related protein
MRAWLLLASTCWLAGIAAGSLNTPLWLFAASIFLAPRSPQGEVGLRGRGANYVALVSLLLLGFVYGREAGQPAAANSACDIPADVVGHIQEVPNVRADRVQYVVTTAEGCTLLVDASRWPVFKQGSVLALGAGKVQAVTELPENLAGYRDYLIRRGITHTWRWPEVVAVSEPRASDWHGVLRERIAAVFREPAASLVSGMLFADTGRLPENLVEQFRVSGVTHVIAISGSHISLLAGALFFLLAPLPLPPLARTGTLLGLLWAYIFFAGAPPSAVRAGFFWSFTLLAFRLQWLVSLPTVLFLTALVVLTYDPLMIHDVGFQLSLVAVAGIFLALFISRPLRKNRSPFAQAFLVLMIVSLGASLATWPLTAYHFGLVSFVSVLANLVIVPAASIFMFLSAAALALSWIAWPAALSLAWLVHGIVFLMDKVTAFLAFLPGSYIDDVSLPAWTIPVYYLAVAVACILLLRYQKRSWREVWE